MEEMVPPFEKTKVVSFNHEQITQDSWVPQINVHCEDRIANITLRLMSRVKGNALLCPILRKVFRMIQKTRFFFFFIKLIIVKIFPYSRDI